MVNSRLILDMADRKGVFGLSLCIRKINIPLAMTN